MKRKHILFCGEATFLSTGFSTYQLEVMKRLHATGKYELAELASYGSVGDERALELPWGYYPVLPDPGDEGQVAEYNAKATNQFGEWRFEQACLDFRPDVILDIRDHWMLEFEERSPFRPYYHHVIMPTVDSIPQAEEWLATYASADGVFSYSDWGLGVLREQGQGRIRTLCSAPPGADLETLRPVADRRSHKRQMGLPDDSLVVGTIMRNQRRKLYPDLIAAFAAFLREAPPDLARRCYLYLHVSYPDIGWDIPRLVKEAGVGSRTLFTYTCTNCGVSFPSFYMDARAYCRRCGTPNAGLPNSQRGVPRNVLCNVLNFMDVYIQYANCLKPGTGILLRRGWTSIEEVLVGDEAYTHQGRWRPVLRTFRHDTGDRPLDIRVWGDYELLTITAEHPVYTITAASSPLIRGRSLRETLGHRLRNNQVLPQPAFVPAGQLKPGDMLVHIIDDTVLDINDLDLATYASICDTVGETEVSVKWGKTYPRFVSVDSDFCEFLGLFAADGSSSVKKGSQALRVTCHLDELENQKAASTALAQMTGTARVRPYKDRLASSLHARLFRYLCGTRERKRLPPWAIWLPIHKQQAILKGLFMGDGHYLANRKVSVYVTTSRILADQVKCLCRRCRVNFNVRIVKKSGTRRDQFRFEVPGNIASGATLPTPRSSTGNLYLGNWHLLKVKSVTTSHHKGSVYNIEVGEDNSYHTKICVVHNSEGFGMPQVEAAACGVPTMAVDYSAMSDVVRKLKGTPIKVLALDREADTGCYRAVPDNADLVGKLVHFLSLPEGVRLRQGFAARKAVERHYSYDQTTRIWEEYFDSLPVRDQRQTWRSPARLHSPLRIVPANLTDEEFVRWGIINLAGRPDLVNGYLTLRLVRDLNWGVTLGSTPRAVFNELALLGTQVRPVEFDRQKAAEELMQMCHYRNFWEQQRAHASHR